MLEVDTLAWKLRGQCRAGTIVCPNDLKGIKLARCGVKQAKSSHEYHTKLIFGPQTFHNMMI